MSIIRGFLPAMLTVMAALVGAPLTAVAEPQPVWSTSGFSSPESALYDADRDVLYVSNINGKGTDKDGNGFISRLSPGGEIIELEWVTGLNAPKGLVQNGSTLYVSDIDRLVAIDINMGRISGEWAAPEAKFLNDTAVDEQGRVYVSDMADDTIYVLDGDQFGVWLKDPGLAGPNGLRVDNGQLLIAAWGTMEPDFSTKVSGHLKAVDLETKVISSRTDGAPLGNLDGLEPDGNGGWLVTDWVAGGLLRINADGSVDQLLDLDKGSADLGYIESRKLVIVPMMLDGRVDAWQID